MSRRARRDSPDAQQQQQQQKQEGGPAKKARGSGAGFEASAANGGGGSIAAAWVSSVPAAGVRKEKLKTIMDVGYDLMSAEKVGSMSKADIYDHWLDMRNSEKHPVLLDSSPRQS